MVAGLAAGSARSYPGAAPTAGIVSLDVMDDKGMARTSDVIRAADWIFRNKDRYGIRVANFSLHSSTISSFRWDPLDKAVEKLWFSGVVVVTSAGNDGKSSHRPVRMGYAPANDPFVITVGALDLHGSASPGRADVPQLVFVGLHLRRIRQARAGRSRARDHRARSERLHACEPGPLGPGDPNLRPART